MDIGVESEQKSYRVVAVLAPFFAVLYGAQRKDYYYRKWTNVKLLETWSWKQKEDELEVKIKKRKIHFNGTAIQASTCIFSR